MNTLLPQLNCDLGELGDSVRRSLVQVSAGGCGSGCGLIFSADGRIVTNAQVIAGDRSRQSSELKITLLDGKTAAARVLAEDNGIDVAVVKIEQPVKTLLEFHPIEAENSRIVRAGQWVMAMGYPCGVPGTAAGGIVIGVGPELPESPGLRNDWIAVDLALRLGHSGGTLVDHEGHLLRISTMMAGLEVGLAVPVNAISEFVANVLSEGLAEGLAKCIRKHGEHGPLPL